MICPCKGCTDRSIEKGNCHSYCEKYIEWKTEWDKRREDVQSVKYREMIDRQIIRDSVERCAKSRRKRK